MAGTPQSLTASLHDVVSTLFEDGLGRRGQVKVSGRSVSSQVGDGVVLKGAGLHVEVGPGEGAGLVGQVVDGLAGEVVGDGGGPPDVLPGCGGHLEQGEGHVGALELVHGVLLDKGDELFVGVGLGAAEGDGLADGAVGIGGELGGLGDVQGVDGSGLGGLVVDAPEVRLCGDAVEELVFVAVDDRGSEDGGVGEGLFDGFFTLGLGSVKVALGVVAGVDVREVDQAGDTGVVGDSGNATGALDVDVCVAVVPVQSWTNKWVVREAGSLRVCGCDLECALGLISAADEVDHHI